MTRRRRTHLEPAIAVTQCQQIQTRHVGAGSHALGLQVPVWPSVFREPYGTSPAPDQGPAEQRERQKGGTAHGGPTCTPDVATTWVCWRAVVGGAAPTTTAT